ncbi:MAG: hypothetical protein IPH89_12195 [Bacteroidetes bacterium]|nr:hypothetical protein [Bacteroidota bacterium]
MEKWTVYYDINKKQKAFETETIYHKSSLEYREKGISWYRDGAIKSKNYIDGDTAIWLNYYQNGQVKRIYKELWGIPEYYEIPQHTWIVFSELNYYQNGQLKHTPIDSKSKDHCTRVQSITVYFENGKPNFQCNYLCMVLVGEYREYYENGYLKTSGSYTTDINKYPWPSSWY